MDGVGRAILCPPLLVRKSFSPARRVEVKHRRSEGAVKGVVILPSESRGAMNGNWPIKTNCGSPLNQIPHMPQISHQTSLEFFV
jgi:hypothetical protein